MRADTEPAERSDLIEGGAGPFYVALNRATFYLIAGVFVAIVPIVLYVIRDAPAPVAAAVALGIALESGAVVHIMIERVMKRPSRLAWSAHIAISIVLAVALLLIVTR